MTGTGVVGEGSDGPDVLQGEIWNEGWRRGACLGHLVELVNANVDMLGVESAVHKDGAADLQNHRVLRKETPCEGATRLDC